MSDHKERPTSAAGSSDAYEQVGTLTRSSDSREFPLGFGCLRIGRQRRADLPLSDKTVSRHHADICYESGRYVLYDYSANGTWINETLVAVAHTLRDGEAVKFGRVEFRFALKQVPKQVAAQTEAMVPTRIPRWSTRLIKGGKRRGKEYRGFRLRWLIAIVVLAVVVAAAVYFFFPDLIDRLTG